MFASRTNWRLEKNRLTRALEEHRRSGKELFDLTTSNPTTCGLAYPEREILTALTDPRGLVYRPESKGLLEAREQPRCSGGGGRHHPPITSGPGTDSLFAAVRFVLHPSAYFNPHRSAAAFAPLGQPLAEGLC